MVILKKYPMKKVLLLILFCIPVMNYAQSTFAPVGAEWWYGGDNIDYIDFQLMDVRSTWMSHVQSVGDTVIAGMPCRQLLTTTRSRYANLPDTIFSQSGSTFVYDNTDTVFVYSSGSFIPLYVYNVNEGDTVRLSGFFNYNGEHAFRYIVDSIRMELFDTSHLRTYYTHALIESPFYSVNWGISYPGPWLNKGKYTEKLGGTWPKVSGLYPTLTTHATDGRQIINKGPFFGNLRCYSDSAHAISLVSFPCDTLFSPGRVGITDAEILPAGLSVRPNPAYEQVTIACTRAFQADMGIELYDVTGKMLGRIMLRKGAQEVSYDTRSLPEGLYLLRFSTAGSRYYSKMIVKH